MSIKIKRYCVEFEQIRDYKALKERLKETDTTYSENANSEGSIFIKIMDGVMTSFHEFDKDKNFIMIHQFLC